MEQPPPPPLSHFPDPTTTTAAISPRYRPDAAWDDPKLRLMCSYGGHIIPRPHDKSLCYVGGDTRIVVVDRLSSLSDLQARLSHNLLNGRHFSLKYQLPNEDLDSLISIATDEDLENMMEEYDRSAASKPSRLRLFLFPTKLETAASMGSLLDDAKSETWFVNALNGSGGLISRGLSESAVMDALVEIDDHGVGNSTDSCADLEVSKEQSINKQQQAETNSSFGSSSSSPSTANLPPIKVRGSEEVGLDEQFSQSKLGAENWEDRTMRKPPLPLPLPQRKLVDLHNLPSPDSKHGGPHSLPSPDSVASDSSNNGSLSRNTIYQEATLVINRENRVSSPIPTNPKITTTNIIHQDPNSQPPQQQHFIPNNTHYISSYYPQMYLHPQTQQPDPLMQYPMYVDVSSSGPPMKPEMGGTLQQVMVQVPAGHQYQQHYIGVSPPQPVQYSNVATSNYGYEYSPHHHHHVQDHQGYYGQHIATSAAVPPPQYQTMTPAAALMFSQHAASTQLPPDNNTNQS